MSNVLTPPALIFDMLRAIYAAQVAYPEVKLSPDGLMSNNIGKLMARELGADMLWGVDNGRKGFDGWMLGTSTKVRVRTTTGASFVMVAGKADILMVFNLDLFHALIEVVYNGPFDVAMKVGVMHGDRCKVSLKQLRALRDKQKGEVDGIAKSGS